VSTELTSVGRVVVWFDVEQWSGSVEELRSVDARIEKVSDELEKPTAVEEGDMKIIERLSDQWHDIEREWKEKSESCRAPELEEENPSKWELAEAGGFPYVGSGYDSDCNSGKG